MGRINRKTEHYGKAEWKSIVKTQFRQDAQSRFLLEEVAKKLDSSNTAILEEIVTSDTISDAALHLGLSEEELQQAQDDATSRVEQLNKQLSIAI